MSDSLISAIKARLLSKSQAAQPRPSGPYPPLTEEIIRRQESRLGYTLPPLLRRLYIEVGNGGFGPEWGLLNLVPISPLVDHSIPTLYFDLRGKEESEIRWHAGVIPFSNWGCLILSCVDLSDPQTAHDPPVLRYEPNAPDSDTRQYLKGAPYRGKGLIPEIPSLSRWFNAWLQDEEMFNRPYL